MLYSRFILQIFSNSRCYCTPNCTHIRSTYICFFLRRSLWWYTYVSIFTSTVFCYCCIFGKKPQGRGFALQNIVIPICPKWRYEIRYIVKNPGIYTTCLKSYLLLDSAALYCRHSLADLFVKYRIDTLNDLDTVPTYRKWWGIKPVNNCRKILQQMKFHKA